jgi:hypothetical protein
LLFLSAREQLDFELLTYGNGADAQDVLRTGAAEKTKFTHLDEKPWTLARGSVSALVERLVNEYGLRMRDIATEVITGVKTGSNGVFVLDSGNLNDDQMTLLKYKDTSILRSYLKADNLRHYYTIPSSRYVIYPYELIGNKTTLISESRLKKEFEGVWHYLCKHKSSLEGRQKGKLKGPNWYGMSFASTLSMFEAGKLVTPTLAPTPRFSLDEHAQLFPQGAGGGMGILVRPDCPKYVILGIVNSRLISFFIRHISSRFQGSWYAYEPRYVQRIPLPKQLLEKNKRLDAVTDLVQQMLNLHERLPKTRTDHERTALSRQIDHTDAEIDRLVYALYGLSEAEIALVEEAAK